MALTDRPQFASGRAVWRFLARHQLVELIAIIVAIMLAWLGTALGSGHI